VQIASLLSTLGQADSALAYAERAVEQSVRYRPGSLLHAHALQAHSFAWQVKGNIERARPLIEAGIAVLRRLPSDSAQLRLASALVNLAFLDQNQGRLDSAVARMRESVAIRRALMDPTHPTIANSISSLGNFLMRAGNVSEPEPLLREALSIRRHVYPEGHPEIAESQEAYAQLQALTGDLAGAEENYNEALGFYLLAFGSRDVRVAQLRNRLGLFLLFRRGDPGAAEAQFRESASFFTEARGASDPWTAVVEGNLATALLAQGRTAEAAAIIQRVIPALEAAYSETGSALVRPLVDYGVVLTRAGRLSEAETALRRAIAIEQAIDPEGVQFARAEVALGVCLLEQNRLEEAEVMLVDARMKLEASTGSDPYRDWAVSALATLRERQGKR
jgi:tetratricopeptide (TPR) repeat protein